MYDATSFDQIKPKLDHYFIFLVLPRIMRGKKDQIMEIHQISTIFAGRGNMVE